MNHQPVSSSVNRRKFIQGAVVSSAILGFPAITQSKSPNGKLAVGMIGVGGRGRSHVAACRNEQVVALCDVNKKTTPFPPPSGPTQRLLQGPPPKANS